MAWGSVGLAVLAASLATFGCALVMAVASWRRRRALDDVLRVLEQLARGQRVRQIGRRVGGRTGRLVGLVNRLAPDLESRLGRLEQDLQQLRAVLSGMVEGVLAVDSRRRLLLANESARRLFNLEMGADGRMIVELIRSPQVHHAVEATLTTREPYRGEITLESREALAPDSERVLAVLGTRLPGSPPPGAVLVFHDITDLRRLERMRQDFVANVSHELKTPLASINAYTETLLDWALHDDKVNVRYLRQIAEQADRLDRLVLDLLSLSRIESGREAFRHEPLAVAPIVSASAESHRGRAQAKGLQFQLDLGPPDEPVQVQADEEAVRQIVDNLIDNAIKYTPEGGWVRVSIQPVDGEVALEVADSGIGIPRSELPRIFERFYRVDKARSRELGGTGLGLSIVKHLVQALGGRISVSSRPGAGSQFTVRLPRSPSAVPESG